jgi:sorbitol/mannitol transport system permease protein
LIITSFFLMPSVSAPVWNDMFLNPMNGHFTYAAKCLGLEPFEFLGAAPLALIIIIGACQWLPFAALISLQSLDCDQIRSKPRR